MEEYGHVTVRLLPYHPELNPVELEWAKVSNEVAGENVTNNLVEVKKNGRSKIV